MLPTWTGTYVIMKQNNMNFHYEEVLRLRSSQPPLFGNSGLNQSLYPVVLITQHNCIYFDKKYVEKGDPSILTDHDWVILVKKVGIVLFGCFYLTMFAFMCFVTDFVEYFRVCRQPWRREIKVYRITTKLRQSTPNTRKEKGLVIT